MLVNRLFHNLYIKKSMKDTSRNEEKIGLYVDEEEKRTSNKRS